MTTADANLTTAFSQSLIITLHLREAGARPLRRHTDGELLKGMPDANV
jgi:hypothetical protein